MVRILVGLLSERARLRSTRLLSTRLCALLMGALLMATIVLAGCSPRYSVQKQYIPAASSAFPQCANQCELDNRQCLSDCQVNHQACLQAAYERSKEIHQRALAEYQQLKKSYQINQAEWQRIDSQRLEQRLGLDKDYRYFKQQCDAIGKAEASNSYACNRTEELSGMLVQLDKAAQDKPLQPVRPDFEPILDKQQRYCEQECGCDARFDRCYSNCGGQVIPVAICIENCEDE